MSSSWVTLCPCSPLMKSDGDAAEEQKQSGVQEDFAQQLAGQQRRLFAGLVNIVAVRVVPARNQAAERFRGSFSMSSCCPGGGWAAAPGANRAGTGAT